MTIATIIGEFKKLKDADPRINAFGCGPLSEIVHDIKYYPYMWILNDQTHTVMWTEVNKYRAVEFNFILRIGDKVNNQKNTFRAIGENSNNGLDISSDTFQMILDAINTISEGSLNLFPNLELIDDINITPFFHEDDGDVNGHEAELKFRLAIKDPCINPLTDLS
jgi:hypothetical protein